MRIPNRLTAPFLLVAAMIVLILFQSVFFKAEGVVYTGEETAGGFIIYDNIKYNPDRFFMLTVISNLCAFLLPAVFYVKLKGAGYSKNLKFDVPKPKYISLAVFMFAALISGSVLINSLTVYLSGAGADAGSVLPSLVNTGGNPIYDMGVLITFVVLPSFSEEFFFRSVMSAEYEIYGPCCAVTVTSAAFAMTHFSMKFFPAYFFAAAILYILARITNSVLFAVIVHAGYNFFNIYLWDKLSGVLDFEQNRLVFIFVDAIIFMLSIYFVLNRLENIYYNKAYMNEPSPVYPAEGKRGNAAIVRLLRSFFSPAFIAAAVIFFIYVNI